jgi:hypothetical protein
MNLLEAFTARLEQLIHPGNAYALAKAIWTRRELAEKISGSTDHKSKPYKAALRNLERYDAPAGKQQRAPSKATLDKLVGLLRQDQGAIELALRGQGGARVRFEGEFKVSEDRRTRKITFDLSEQGLAEVLAALEQGYAAFFETLWERYGVVPDAIAKEQVSIQ